MKVYKTILGQKTPFYIKFLPNTMSVEVELFMVVGYVIGKISDDFNYIILPDGGVSIDTITHGKQQVYKLKLNKYAKFTAMEYNGIVLNKTDSIEQKNEYPLIDNKRWYAQNGIVYNEVDDECLIGILHNNGGYGNLPSDIATMIAKALNNR